MKKDATQKPANVRLQRVLALDGGQAYVEAGMLAAIDRLVKQQEDEREFLNEITVFSGTSAGAWMALFLANYRRPSDALPDLMDFWADLLAALRPEGLDAAFRGVAATLGQSSLLGNTRLRDFLLSVFGLKTKLGDLKHHVVIPSYQITQWKDKVFQNFIANDPDQDELVVDVAMRSSASPLMLPLWQALDGKGPGYVDGGFFAPTPSLTALAQILHQMPGTAHTHPLPQLITMLSVGLSNRNHVRPVFVDGSANWGYGPWILDPANPMLMLMLSLWAGTMANDYITRQLLGKERYFRLAPYVGDSTPGFLMNSAQLNRYVDQVVSEPAVASLVQQAASWVKHDSSGWFEEAS
jgi:uncharacterized protein